MYHSKRGRHEPVKGVIELPGGAYVEHACEPDDRAHSFWIAKNG